MVHAIMNDLRYSLSTCNAAILSSDRARVHGKITQGKLNALRNGMEVDGTFYKGMKVNIETNKGNRAKGGNTNTWLRITCIEGKNRQIRRTLDHLGLKVTRLIRISYGDYNLNTIPPGMAIEVPVKTLEMQKHKGPMLGVHQISRKNVKIPSPSDDRMANPTVQWIRQL
jgi:23S rRNA pseudouridine2605 synthase